MNPVLAQWNALASDEAIRQILPCCGSHAWATQMSAARPVFTPEAITSTSDQIWTSLPEPDQQAALATHPRIGERHATAMEKSLNWSAAEQSAASADEPSRAALAEANRLYEGRFNRTFIICATNKSAEEILTALHRRLTNPPDQELAEVIEQQRQITRLRLHKWLEGR